MLQQVRLDSFRCLANTDFFPQPGANYLVGPNAVGKTSLLEAICVVLRLQSPRTSQLNRCIRLGDAGFSLEGRWNATPAAQNPVQMRMVQGASGRRLFLDGIRQSRSESYLAHGRVTWFGNTDLELVRGGGSGRRRFLDFLCAQVAPGYLRDLRSYERALRGRNFLLKEGRPWREIAAQSEPLIEAGDRLAHVRRTWIPHLRPWFLQAVADIGGQEEPDLQDMPGHAGSLRAALTESRVTDERARMTLVGPHRDDFLLLLQKQPAAEYASEGQQRTLALALKLAQARLLAEETAHQPVLLLDDIFGELDPHRRNRLLAALPASSQSFVTTTFLDWHEVPPDAGMWQIQGGRIFPKN